MGNGQFLSSQISLDYTQCLMFAAVAGLPLHVPFSTTFEKYLLFRCSDSANHGAIALPPTPRARTQGHPTDIEVLSLLVHAPICYRENII